MYISHTLPIIFLLYFTALFLFFLLTEICIMAFIICSPYLSFSEFCLNLYFFPVNFLWKNHQQLHYPLIYLFLSLNSLHQASPCLHSTKIVLFKMSVSLLLLNFVENFLLILLFLSASFEF